MRELWSMLKQGVDYRGGESVVSMAKILQNAAHVWMEIAMMTIDPVRGLLFCCVWCPKWTPELLGPSRYEQWGNSERNFVHESWRCSQSRIETESSSKKDGTNRWRLPGECEWDLWTFWFNLKMEQEIRHPIEWKMVLFYPVDGRNCQSGDANILM